MIAQIATPNHLPFCYDERRAASSASAGRRTGLKELGKSLAAPVARSFLPRASDGIVSSLSALNLACAL